MDRVQPLQEGEPLSCSLYVKLEMKVQFDSKKGQ